MFRFVVNTFFFVLSIGCYAQKMDISRDNDSSICIIEYDENIHFTYKSNIFLKKDTEQLKPKDFEVSLPKKIKYWEVINGSSFGFYYRNKQVIFISTNFPNRQFCKDTTFIPSHSELLDIIDRDFCSSGNFKWDHCCPVKLEKFSHN